MSTSIYSTDFYSDIFTKDALLEQLEATKKQIMNDEKVINHSFGSVKIVIDRNINEIDVIV